MSKATKGKTSLKILQHHANVVYGLCLDASSEPQQTTDFNNVLNEAGIKYFDIM
jgi:hypothetical protein